MNVVVRSTFRSGGERGLPVAMSVMGVLTLGACVCCVALLLIELNHAAASQLVHLGLMLVITPLAEEVVFRGGLQEALIRRSIGLWAANLAASSAFVVAHLVVREDLGAIAVLAPSLVLGLLYERSRSIVLCALLHAGMNGVWLVLYSLQ